MLKLSLKNNYYFYFILIIALFLSSTISYENISFDLYFNNKYKDYSDYFKGLLMGKRVLVYYDLGTFPMWGYGLIHLLFKSKLNILIVQQLLNFIAIVKVDQFLIKVKKIKYLKLSRILLLLSLPYFFFHTQMWPKSISSSLLILGVLQIFYYLENNKILNLVFTGLFFGLLSNFRSDYLMLIFLFPFLILAWEFINQENLKISSVRLFIIPVITIILLIPWGIFTLKNTGHYLLKSTNTGHTFFIGLGQLPDNIWGITPRDDDAKMHKALVYEFQTEEVNSVGYDENKFLIQEFKKNVMKNPSEWIKKCLFAFRLLLLDPFYVGNVGDFQKNGISNIIEIRAIEESLYRFEFEKSISIFMNTQWRFASKELIQITITVLTKIIGLMIFITSLISILYLLIKSRGQVLKDGILFLSILLIGYQIAISVFAFHMPVYNNTIYLIYIILIVLFYEKIFFNQTVDNN